MNLTLHQLEVFEAVGRNGSVSKAADQLFLDQSTVSVHIRQMEKALGVRLITFANKRLELTEAGLLLLDAAQRVSTILSSASDGIVQLRGGVRGRLRIGMRNPVATYLFPPVIKELKLSMPKVELEIVTGPSIDFPQMLLARELDLVITHSPPDTSFFATSLYFIDRLLLVATRATLQSDPQLTNTPLVAREPNLTTRRIMDSWLRKRGLVFREVVERPNMELIKNDVCRERVVGLVSHYSVLAELASEQLMVVGELPSERSPSRNFYFLYRRDGYGVLLDRFIQLARGCLPAFIPC